MSSLVSKDKELKFLLDENVKKELLQFLKHEGINVTFKPKELSNGKLAKFSSSEQRVFVTNDRDFTGFTKKEIFSVVWLRIPQDEPETLLKSFSKLIKEKPKSEDFEGSFITLYENGSEVFPLPSLT